MENTESRNRDFMAACRRCTSQMMDEGIEPRVDDVIRRVIVAPAPAYYISYSRARRAISEYMRGKESYVRHSAARSARREMIAELAYRCREMTEAQPGMTISEALARILTSESASSFFLTFEAAKTLYFDLRREIHRRRDRLRGRRLL